MILYLQYSDTCTSQYLADHVLWESDAALTEKLCDTILPSHFKNSYQYFHRIGRSVWRHADCENWTGYTWQKVKLASQQKFNKKGGNQMRTLSQTSLRHCDSPSWKWNISFLFCLIRSSFPTFEVVWVGVIYAYQLKTNSISLPSRQ